MSTFLINFVFNYYVCRYRRGDYGMDDVDDIKPKLLLYYSLKGEKGKTSSTTSTSSREKSTCPT